MKSSIEFKYGICISRSRKFRIPYESMSHCKKTHYTYACGHPLVWYTYCGEHADTQERNKQCFDDSPRARQHRGTTNGGRLGVPCGESLCAPGVYRYYCCSCPSIPNVANQLVMAFVPSSAVFLNAQNLPAHHFMIYSMST